MPDQSLSPIPRQGLTGGLADVLRAVLDYANKPGPATVGLANPVLPILINPPTTWK